MFICVKKQMKMVCSLSINDFCSSLFSLHCANVIQLAYMTYIINKKINGLQNVLYKNISLKHLNLTKRKFDCFTFIDKFQCSSFFPASLPPSPYHATQPRA